MHKQGHNLFEVPLKKNRPDGAAQKNPFRFALLGAQPAIECVQIEQLAKVAGEIASCR